VALIVLNLKPGDEVITTDMTFCATVNAIIHAGLTPVIVDCNKETFNIDPEEIEKKITTKTKAILPVHFAGRPCEMDQIMDICKRYNLHLISDAAHAIETRYNNKSVAELSDITCYSLYATKNICIAEGGFLLTNSEDYIEASRIKALHGMSKNASKRFGPDGFKHYSVDVLGYKYNMPDTAASLGISQLRRVEESWKRREQIWNKYMTELFYLPCSLPARIPEHMRHAHHLFTINIHPEELKVSRDFILNAIQAENITTGVHYRAIHAHPYYTNTFGWDAKDYPNAQWLSDRTLSLPLSSKLTDKDIDDVINAVTRILMYYRK
jgi:dTDP-4-amino-4,6-dideoxygalactose transaminase